MADYRLESRTNPEDKHTEQPKKNSQKAGGSDDWVAQILTGSPKADNPFRFAHEAWSSSKTAWSLSDSQARPGTDRYLAQAPIDFAPRDKIALPAGFGIETGSPVYKTSDFGASVKGDVNTIQRQLAACPISHTSNRNLWSQPDRHSIYNRSDCQSDNKLRK